MFEGIIVWTLIVVWEIFRPIIFGGILAMIIGITFDFSVNPSLDAFVWLLPAIFLYRFSYILKLKYYICDILYFVGIVSAGLYWIHSFFKCSASGFDAADISDCKGICIFYIYILLFVGLVIYLIEIIFRNKKYLKKLGYKYQFNNINWQDIWGQIFNCNNLIFKKVFKSYIIAVLSFFIPLNMYLPHRESSFIFYDLLFCLCLLPAIILYHSAYNLKLMVLICDIFYIVVFVCIEIVLFFLLFILRDSGLPAFDINMILRIGIFGTFHSGIVVYLSEVYFRNRAILKSLEQRIISEGGTEK